MELHNRQKTLSGEIPYADCGEDIRYPQGLKWTRQRKSVYKVLWEAPEPLSAIQIYQRVAADGADGQYAVSTIYRILAAFEEKGLAEKTVWMEDGSVVYSLNRGGHTHYAICLKCHNRIPCRAAPLPTSTWRRAWRISRSRDISWSCTDTAAPAARAVSLPFPSEPLCIPHSLYHQRQWHRLKLAPSLH